MKHKWLFAATIGASVIVAPVVTDASFTDVKKGTEQGKAIQALVDRSIISGYADGTFKPGNKVTRSQFAKILAGALKLDTENVKDPGFKDVTLAHANYKYIAALANAGIISGSNGNFNPSGQVTRGQLAKMLAIGFKLEKKLTANMPFKDAVKSPNLPYIQSLLAYGITKGVSADEFGVNKPLTRGQLAVFIYRTEQFKAALRDSEIIKGKELIVDPVQFGVKLFDVFTDNFLNDDVVDIRLEEGSYRVIFTPLKEGTAFLNLALLSSDRKEIKELIGYKFDVQNVNGELQSTMTKLERPTPNTIRLDSGDYSAVEIYTLSGEKASYNSTILQENSNVAHVYLNIDKGYYKAVFTTSTGEEVEKNVIVAYQLDGITLNVLLGEIYYGNPITIELNPAIQNMQFNDGGNTKFEVKDNTLTIHNPQTLITEYRYTLGNENKEEVFSLVKLEDGVFIPERFLNQIIKEK